MRQNFHLVGKLDESLAFDRFQIVYAFSKQMNLVFKNFVVIFVGLTAHALIEHRTKLKQCLLVHYVEEEESDSSFAKYSRCSFCFEEKGNFAD